MSRGANISNIEYNMQTPLQYKNIACTIISHLNVQCAPNKRINFWSTATLCKSTITSTISPRIAAHNHVLSRNEVESSLVHVLGRRQGGGRKRRWCKRVLRTARSHSLRAQVVHPLELLGDCHGASRLNCDYHPDCVAKEVPSSCGHSPLGLVDPRFRRRGHLNRNVCGSVWSKNAS